MGIYLNSTSAFYLYRNESKSPYFVDKSMMLTELFPLLQTGNKHLCITRPRRFGKTIMANMIGAFLGKGAGASTIFEGLKIAEDRAYQKYINQYDVIYIDFSELPEDCISYQQYIQRIRKNLKQDLINKFFDLSLDEEDAVWDILRRIFEETGTRFVFVMDEWDCIFHKSFVTTEDKTKYISFLSNLLKDRPYVLLSYMTGILPIAKYSSGSELNMFMEYTMISEEKFSDAFGFLDYEVDELYQRYLKHTKNPKVTREGLRIWYNGYHTFAGESVPAKIQEYAATSMKLTTRDEIFSAMVVYGFLNYEKGKVSIPNKELMDKFDAMLVKEPSLGYVYQLAKESEKMLEATLHGDTETMSKILEYAHNTEVPILSYNHETELSAILNLVYLAARDWYRVEREDKAGVGFVDFIFYPYDRTNDCIILELKVDNSPKEAIQQIIDKKYVLRFKGKLGEKNPYTGRILAVGIGYDKKEKQHKCEVKVLSQQYEK